MNPENITAATITESGVVTALADLLAEAVKGSIEHERGSSAGLTIKVDRDKDSGVLALLCAVRASYPTSETETTAVKLPHVCIANVTTEHPGQTRLEM